MLKWLTGDSHPRVKCVGGWLTLRRLLLSDLRMLRMDDTVLWSGYSVTGHRLIQRARTPRITRTAWTAKRSRCDGTNSRISIWCHSDRNSGSVPGVTAVWAHSLRRASRCCGSSGCRRPWTDWILVFDGWTVAILIFGAAVNFVLLLV